MKLYLSSYRIGSNPAALRALVGSGSRAGVMFNACDVFEERTRELPREFGDLAGLGFEPEEVDLRSYFGTPDALHDRLAALDLLWVVGGNTFALARAMDASGFAAAIEPLLHARAITYAGYSAGVCVTGPGLEGIDLMDDPDAVPDGYPPDTSPTTLGWVPWRVVPHWRSDHAESDLADVAVDALLRSGLPFRTLRDGQAIVVDGDDDDRLV